MVKVKKEDGSTYYYYYKKKRGRKKKRGPKKKKSNYILKGRETWDYKILRFDFRKQTDYIGKYHNLLEVSEKIKELEERNNSVEFPVKYINNKRISNDFVESLSEYVILKRKGDYDDVTMLRNEFGKLVENKVTSEEWVVYDKIRCYDEEHFWVYGFNPKTDRKDIKFIYTNLIENVINEGYNWVIIYIYNNKVIFRYDGGNVEFVICKNIHDAVRMYNFLEEKYRSEKRVTFTGSTNGKSYRVNDILSILMKKTGWSKSKLYKTNTLK